MTKNKTRLGSLTIALIGSVLVVTGVAFSFASLYNDQSTKSAKALSLAALSPASYAVNCDPVLTPATTTTCVFGLPAQYATPPVTLGIGDATPGGNCTRNSDVVTCTDVPIGTKTRIQPIFAKEGGLPPVNTGDQVYIQPNNSKTVLGNFVFSPEKGSTAPLFRSSDPVQITLKNFKSDRDSNPVAGAYTCTFAVRPFQPTTSTANWTILNPNTASAYDPINGCSTQFSKAIRGTGLNWSVKTTVTSVADSNITYDIYDSFVYRFQGAGIAAGS